MSVTKAELLEKAKAQNLDVSEENTVAEIKDALNNAGNVDTEAKHEEVTVNENQDGEATNNTTQDGEESPVTNTESIPQNGVTEIKTTEPDNPIAERADAARTEEEIKFADESNPNQRARTRGAQGDVDADGNERTGGKSYAVAADDPSAPAPQNSSDSNSDFPASSLPGVQAYEADPTPPGQLLGGTTNSEEAEIEDQQELEDSLADPEHGITARVIISAGTYYKVKFFRNNLIFGIYKSKNWDKAKAAEFRDNLLEAQGLK